MRAPDPEHVKAAADRAERRAGGGPEPRGRGRLSSIDQLPEEADEDVHWATTELNARKLTQDEIRHELNDRLARKGLDEISRSAFNRRAVKMAALSKRVGEARALFEGLAPQFTAERMDQSTVVIGEFIKLLIFELAQSEGGAIGAKGAMELAKGQLAVIQAQKLSTDRRAKLEAEFKRDASVAIDRVAAAKGLSSEARDALKADFLGIAAPTPAAA